VDEQHRLVTGLGEDHAQAQPREVARAQPLHRKKRRRVLSRRRISLRSPALTARYSRTLVRGNKSSTRRLLCVGKN
jgi:hypothetical protein